MATPVAPFKPSNLVTTKTNDADVSAAATVQTYTVPAGRAAFLRGAGARLTAGAAPTLILVWTSGAVAITLTSLTTLAYTQFSQWMAAGDVLTWEVTIGGVAGTADLCFSIEEYEVG